jgi:UDP-N-acetylglucosamine 2-epimerase
MRESTPRFPAIPRWPPPKSIGLGVIGFADAFARLQPDLVVLLGDRFESFAAARAAMTALIPIAHIHGGELTQGAIDEAMRHAMTRMARLHLTAAEAYRQRIIQFARTRRGCSRSASPGSTTCKISSP